MASNDAVAPTEAAWRDLKRQYWQTRRELVNLKNRLASDARRQSQRQHPPRIRFKNTASETAPAWGIMRITTPTSGADYLNIAKPDSTYRWVYLVNGPKDVPAGSMGYGHYLTAETFIYKRHYVLFDTNNTPVYGEEWGPVADSWKLGQHRPGFIIKGGTKGSGSTARVVAIQVPPNSVLVNNDSGSSQADGSQSDYGIFCGAAGSESDSGLILPDAYNHSGNSFAEDLYALATRDHGAHYVWPMKSSGGSLPRAGGYRLPSNSNALNVGTTDVVWDTFYSNSNSLFTVDAGSPKKKININETGDYMVSCKLVVAPSGPIFATARMTLYDASGSLGFEDYCTLTPEPNGSSSPGPGIGTASLDITAMVHVTSAPTYIYAKVTTGAANIAQTGIGQFLAWEVSGS